MSAPVDLRSDTVTRPSPTMRRAMAEAEVGDDWYGDDPTVNRLQERAAEVTGKGASLFVPTGTMANQISVRLHVGGAGHLVVCEASSHVASTEVMSSAYLSGIAFRRVSGDRRGQITAPDVTRALHPDTFYDVEVVDLVSLENTWGGAGTVMPIEEMRAIRKAADAGGVPVHLDGARIFNAAVASGTDVAEYAAEADTMMFCVSKGLGAPVGSLICGPAEELREARRLKILFGGAWRQAGILAAAGLIALEDGPGRLHEDHARAGRLAEALAEEVPGSVEPELVETNMVFADPSPLGLDPLDAVDHLAAEGVLATPTETRVRMVTHLDVDDDGIDRAIGAWRSLATGSRG